MIKLTERRIQQAREILDRYRDELWERRSFNLKELERELLQVWELGYRELKHLIVDLATWNDYELIAVKFMEAGAPGVDSEFRTPLAKIYGIAGYNSPQRKQKQADYWKRAYST